MDQYLAWAPIVVPIIGVITGVSIWAVGLEWRMRGVEKVVNVKVDSLRDKVKGLEDKIDDLIKFLLTRDSHEHERRAD